MTLLSKREKLRMATQGLDCLQCTVCGGKMVATEAGFSCPKGHGVNLNKKGCLNLLSQRVETYYDTDLFQARQRVFEAGCYLPVVEAIESLLPTGEQRLLDAGCGEGWYLKTLLERHPTWQGAGVDLSREAIWAATNWPCTALWCVADLRRLPFAEESFTCVLDVLTPANYEEFARVLQKGGLLIKVYPGRDYLKEIRAARGMPLYEEGQVDAYLQQKTQLLRRERVTIAQPVDANLWRDFVWMTPLNQDLSLAEKEKLAQAPADTVTIDLHVTAVAVR